MSVAFKELGGSPVEKYTLGGFNARRSFLIAWEDRDAFAVEVLGLAVEHGGDVWVNYPGKETVFAYSLRYEPFDPESVDRQEFASLAEGLNSYSGSYAKAVVDYHTVTPRDRDDGPENELGTHLTYRMLFSAEDETVPPGGWSWQDAPAVPLADDYPLKKRVPRTEHHITWHQVIDPPWTTIHQLQGAVNQTEFLSCPAGTLLFEGAEANKLFRAGYEEGASAFCWAIRYVFRERSLKYAGEVYGWNDFYRPEPAGWARVTNGSASMYDEADFLPLFQSIPSE